MNTTANHVRELIEKDLPKLKSEHEVMSLVRWARNEYFMHDDLHWFGDIVDAVEERFPIIVRGAEWHNFIMRQYAFLTMIHTACISVPKEER